MHGGEVDLGKGHLEMLGLVEYDSTTGGSHGGLFGGGLGNATFEVESMRNWSTWQSSTTPIGIGGPSFQMPGPLNGMKGDAGGFFQFDNGLNIGGYFGGHGPNSGRAAGGGGYLRLGWSGC